MTDWSDVFSELRERRRIERAREAVLTGASQEEARPLVVDSWERSLRARIDPEGWEPPISFASDDLDAVRAAHPLADCIPLLRQTVLNGVDSTVQIMIVTDAEGNILWREGHPQVCRNADRVQLAEGTCWSETAIGTNAMGTALETRTPVRIHSAEHLVRTYHSWTCVACPVHDPDSGELLGVIDLSGPSHTMHPALLTLVLTGARLVESELRSRMFARDNAFVERYGHHLDRLGEQGDALLSPTGRTLLAHPGSELVPGQRVPLDDRAAAMPTTGAEVEVEPLGEGYLLRTRGQGARSSGVRLSLRLHTNGVPTAAVGADLRELSLRHAEILVLLALHPDGLTAERLALLLHGERGNPSTARVEIHRIRNVLGHQVVRTRPYRLGVDVDSDMQTLRDALDRGDVDAALTHHAVPLLPSSESPAIREEREELLARVRGLVLTSADPAKLWAFASRAEGRDDLEVLEKLWEVLPEDSPHRGAVLTRWRAALAEETTPPERGGR